MVRSVDHLIIGAGPAGLAVARRLIEQGGDTLVLEKGASQRDRDCPAVRLGHCGECRNCDVLAGVGGAAGVIGGKLCFFPAGSGILDHIDMRSTAANEEVVRFLADAGVGAHLLAPSVSSGYSWSGRFLHKPYDAVPISHRSLSQLVASVARQATHLGARIWTGAEAIDVTVSDGGGFNVAVLRAGILESVRVRVSLTIAVGRSGQDLVERMLLTSRLSGSYDTVDVGVRLEMPSRLLQTGLPQGLHDPKIKTADGVLRTLCWCRGGELGAVGAKGAALVDGHFGDTLTERTSVSLVARVPVGDARTPMDEALRLMGTSNSLISYQDVAGFLGCTRPQHSYKGPFLQKFRAERVDFGGLIDGALHAQLAELLLILDDSLGSGSLVNGEAHVYGPVVDRTWHKVSLDGQLMAPTVPGLFFAGDAAGLGRGVVQSMLTGLFVARSIRAWEERQDTRRPNQRKTCHVDRPSC